MKATVTLPEDAHVRLVRCGCGYWCELEMESTNLGCVVFSGLCEGCDRGMELRVSAAPRETEGGE